LQNVIEVVSEWKIVICGVAYNGIVGYISSVAIYVDYILPGASYMIKINPVIRSKVRLKITKCVSVYLARVIKYDSGIVVGKRDVGGVNDATANIINSEIRKYKAVAKAE
jgi:hypothetical protein